MQLAGARIAISGASGFLGRYLVATMLRHGAEVVAVVRDLRRALGLPRPGVTLREADLLQPAQLERAFSGCDALIANAGYFSLGDGRWESYERVNVIGGRNALEAALRAGLRRVVLISSASIYRMRLGVVPDEDHPQLDGATPRLRHTVYRLSKALAEQQAWRLAAERGLELTALRPSGIFGAYDVKVLPLLRQVSRWPLVPAAARLGFVYAGDVAEAAALALERRAAIGRAYNVTGGEETVWQLLAALARAEGRPLRALPLPIPLTWLFDARRAVRELGWSRRPLLEAWQEAIALQRAAEQR